MGIGAGRSTAGNKAWGKVSSGMGMSGKSMSGKVPAEMQSPLPVVLKCLLCSYIITVLLLFVLAMLLYSLNLGEGAVAAGIVSIYVAATFVGGFMAGKKLCNRKFLWGLLMGAAYFAVLLIVSLLVNQSVSALGESFLSTLVLCAGGGMLGGMLS